MCPYAPPARMACAGEIAVQPHHNTQGVLVTFRSFISSLLLLSVVAACTVDRKNPVIAPQVVREEGGEEEGVRRLERQIPQTPEEIAEVEKRFKIAADETAQTSVALSSNADQDTEPAVTAINISGTDHTAVAFIKITTVDTPFRALIHTTSTTNLSSFPTPAALTNPASSLSGVTYLNSADPTLAINYYNSGPGPLRTYCAGLAYNMNTNGSHPNGGVAVWRSNDGGSTWAGSSLVAETSGTHVYDKPAVAVSWDTTGYDGHSATVGNVYVAWVDVDTTSNTNDRILFSRSTDGGVNWSSPLTIATGYVHTPQVVVPGNTGRVFVLYARYDTSNTRTNSIEAVRSTDVGVSFSSIATLSATRLLGPGTDQIGPTGNRTYARSVFQARYNPGVGLQVVWHGFESGSTTQADIYYAYYNGSWSSPINLTPAAAGDQWNPAFDYDNSNNAVVTWLDRRNDTSNINYQPYYMKINTSGTTLQAAGALDSSASNPANYTLSPSVGEYIDSWFFNYTSGGKWVSVWPRVSGSGSGDIYSTQITNP